MFLKSFEHREVDQSMNISLKLFDSAPAHTWALDQLEHLLPLGVQALECCTMLALCFVPYCTCVSFPPISCISFVN
ncbi:hypothetical protein F511_20745 [Dorcoceras hygrometricum]|uniref:Uncharacterized protein n=1 Tax=Dorcoceras hygrometricum TaxID=472368 RepID=A0A2Z7DA14_9LAMI|nr:hypothetical protein F511_20745 [Dorcoceras hygrometricum]